MTQTTKLLDSNTSGEPCDYLVVDQIPSHFRSYEQTEVYVRGLYFEESLSLAKYVGSTTNPSYTQLASIYTDVIRGVDILDLELVDFIYLMIVSSIWTVDNFGWQPNIKCSNLIDGDPCDGVITSKIIIDDFDFNDLLIDTLPVPIKLGKHDVSIGALTVRDIIEKEAYMKAHPETDRKVLDYAFSIKNPELTSEEKIKKIRFSPTTDVNQIKDIDNDIHIKIDPILKKCPACGHTNKLKIGLSKIRGYP